MTDEVESEVEVFPSPFVCVVWAEFRFDEALSPQTLGQASQRLADSDYKLIRIGDLNGEESAVDVSKDNDLIAVFDDFVVIGTSQYRDWGRFSAVLSEALTLCGADRDVVGIRLAYTNEIRPASDFDAESWQALTTLPVAGGPALLANVTGSYGGLTVCPDEGDRHLFIEWTVSGDLVLDAQHPLARGYDPPDDGFPSLLIELVVVANTEGLQAPMTAMNSAHDLIKEYFTKLLTEEAIAMMQSPAGSEIEDD